MKLFLLGLIGIGLFSCATSTKSISPNGSAPSLSPSSTPGTTEAASSSGTPKPKYGPEAILLSQSHAYIQKNPAPTYWALSPYYLPQKDDASCSLASVAMAVNAARVGQKLTADDELVTQVGLLKKVDDDAWKVGLGEHGHGVTLDQLKPLVEKSFQAYQVKPLSVTVVHTPDQEPATKAALHRALVSMEKSGRQLIIANFIQGVYTGDADAGHIAPVGAYDARLKRVLIMDPDRQWYEPYWVSEETFLKGMATVDKTAGLFRGYVVVQLPKAL